MRIVFLCVENSSRSQMAEGIAREIFGDSAVIESAGSNPSKVNPLAIEVMNEIGIDISKQRSKSVDEINSNEIDWIITLCAEEIYPYLGGSFKKLHWPFPNPSAKSSETKEKQLELFRKVRDEIRKKIFELQKKLENENS